MRLSIKQPFFLNEKGKRQNNEDYIFPDPGMADETTRLFIVCDGVGGSEKGEVASKMVCKLYSEFVLENGIEKVDIHFFTAALRHVEFEMSKHVAANPSCLGMKTTICFVWFKDGGAYIGWCGDSRVYQFRAGKIIYRTDDHSLVGEMVKSGEISEEEAQWHPHSNVILRAIAGSEAPTEVDIYFTKDLYKDDIFLLCTDGVTENLTEINLQELSSLGDLEMMSEQILTFCENFSRDNYSMYLFAIDDVDLLAENNEVVPKKKKLSSTEEKPSNKHVTKSKESKFLKFLLGGIFLIAIAIGTFSFFNYKENQETLTLVQKANDFEQKNELDSARHYLELAYAKDPDNSTYKDNLEKLKEEAKKREEKKENINQFESRLNILNENFNLLDKDTLLNDSTRMFGLRFVEYEIKSVSGMLNFERGNLKGAFQSLKPLIDDTIALNYVPKQTWDLLKELYPHFEKDEAILQVKLAQCQKMMDLAPEIVDNPF